MFAFIETRLFTRLVGEYLSDDEYLELQAALMKDPEAGTVIPDSGGIRKLRWGLSGRGKRGGLRVIYYLRDRKGIILDADLVPEKCRREHPGICIAKDS